MSWRIAAACSVGTSHDLTGMPCQDSFGVEVLDTSSDVVLVSIVSDGAGSAAHSERGSKAAVETVMDLIRDYLSAGGAVSSIERDLAVSWVLEIRNVITKLAEEAGSTSREFACTLLVGVIGSESAAFVQIGDGAMVTANEADEGWSYIFWPQHGEFANTTNFVTSPNFVEVMDFDIANRRIDDFAAFSDGIENLVLHQATRSVHAPFFTSMLGPVRQLTGPGLDETLSGSLAKYLSSPGICERTDDDKSLVLACRVSRLVEKASDASAS
jgi:hypothetical protein